MALKVRNVPTAVLAALVASYNLLRRELASARVHVDITSTTSGDYLSPVATPRIMTSATATNLATVLLRANDAKAILNVHFLDAVAHKAADVVQITSPDATDQATANTLLNEIKAKLNGHLDETGVHFTDDSSNEIIASDATNLASSITLANAIFGAGNAHIQSAFTSPSLELVSP